MALTHVVDTSVLTRLATPQVWNTVESLLQDAAVARTSISDLEIGYSARDGKEWKSLRQALDAFALIEVSAAHIARAGHVQRLLSERGLKGRKLPDLMIAAAAEERGLTVLHYDADFEHIASVTGQQAQWIVPRGTID